MANVDARPGRPRPAPVSLPHPVLPAADWADAYEMDLVGPSLTAGDAARAAFSVQPYWIALLMSVRNRLARLVRLKPAAVRGQGQNSIGGFPVVAADDREIVLGFDDRHLDFRIVLTVERLGEGMQRICALTLVRRHNYAGFLYLLAVMPFHKLIVPRTLISVAEAFDYI